MVAGGANGTRIVRFFGLCKVHHGLWVREVRQHFAVTIDNGPTEFACVVHNTKITLHATLVQGSSHFAKVGLGQKFQGLFGLGAGVVEVGHNQLQLWVILNLLREAKAATFTNSVEVEVVLKLRGQLVVVVHHFGQHNRIPVHSKGPIS